MISLGHAELFQRDCRIPSPDFTDLKLNLQSSSNIAFPFVAVMQLLLLIKNYILHRLWSCIFCWEV